MLRDKIIEAWVEFVGPQALHWSALRPYLKDVGRSVFHRTVAQFRANDVGWHVILDVVRVHHPCVVFKSSIISCAICEHQKSNHLAACFAAHFFTKYLSGRLRLAGRELRCGADRPTV